MPVISKFYGIAIRMLFSSLLAPRFYAIYGQSELVVQISPLQIIDGDVPPRMRDMVLEWARQHPKELLEAWSRCCHAQQPIPISPLR